MFAPNHCPGGKLLVAPDRLPNGVEFVGVNQGRVNALPERLCQRNSLGERKRHCFGNELLR